MPTRSSGSPPVRRSLATPTSTAARSDAGDLLEVEQLLAVEEAVVLAEHLLRHAVGAPEVAAVGDRDPQIAEGAAEGVEHWHCDIENRVSDRGIGLLVNRAVHRLIDCRRMPVLLALVAVTAVWGVTFVQVKDAVELYPLFPFLALRFGIAALTLALPGAARVRGVGRDGAWAAAARRRAARGRVRAADARARADERLERGLRHRDVRRADAAARPRALPAAGRRGACGSASCSRRPGSR